MPERFGSQYREVEGPVPHIGGAPGQGHRYDSHGGKVPLLQGCCRTAKAKSDVRTDGLKHEPLIWGLSTLFPCIGGVPSMGSCLV